MFLSESACLYFTVKVLLFWAQIIKSKNLGVVILHQSNSLSSSEFCLGQVAESDAFQRDGESPLCMESVYPSTFCSVELGLILEREDLCLHVCNLIMI